MAEKGLNCGINKTSIMATKITVPDIGDFENVEIIEILTKPGAIIKKNDPIVTLESDKSSVEVPSPFSGKISALNVKIGDKVSKGSVLASIEDDKNEISKEAEKLEKPVQTKQRKEKEEQEKQKQGIGSALLKALLAASEKEKYWTMTAEIISENIASLTLHRKCGFREVGYREKLGHRQGVWHDVILLERRSQKTGGNGLPTRKCK